MVEDTSPIYVPAIKWRSGEKTALKQLDDKLKSQTFPLIELVNDEGDNPNDLALSIKSTWRSPAYLDVHHRPTHFGRTALNSVTQNIDGLDLIPVVRLNSPQLIIEGVKNVASMNYNGIAIRIEVSNIENYNLLQTEVDLIIEQMGNITEQIDLIIDFGFVDKHKDCKTIINNLVKNLGFSRWRNIIMLSGAFPLSLSEYKPNEDNFLARTEYTLWRQCAPQIRGDVIFADYTVRNPNNISKGQRGTISLRYTLEDRYQIFKGTLADKGFKYLVHALNARTLYGYMYSERYSWGDGYISEKATQLERCLENGYDPEKYSDFTPGNATDWIAATINHHIALIRKSNLKLDSN
jgi:Beta protein